MHLVKLQAELVNLCGQPEVVSLPPECSQCDFLPVSQIRGFQQSVVGCFGCEPALRLGLGGPVALHRGHEQVVFETDSGQQAFQDSDLGCSIVATTTDIGSDQRCVLAFDKRGIVLVVSPGTGHEAASACAPAVSAAD